MKVYHLLYFLVAVLFVSCKPKENNSVFVGKEIVLRLEPSTENPRNSEGDFIALRLRIKEENS